MTTWVGPLLFANRLGRLSGDELWDAILDCHRLEDPYPSVVAILKRLGLEPPPEPPTPPLDTGEFVVVTE